MMVLIYCIINKINGKRYIGQTRQTLRARWTRHVWCARGGANRHLYDAMRKYGFDNFEIIELERCSDADDLDARERHWISELGTTDRAKGYNMTPGGGGGDTFTNNPRKEELRARWQKRTWTPSQRQKAIASMTGIKKGPMSVEQREKLRQIGLAQGHRPPSTSLPGEKHPMWGKTHTEEARKKISEAGKGRVGSEKQREGARQRMLDPARNPATKVIPKDELEALIRSGERLDMIAAKYKVSRQTVIHKIRNYWDSTMNALKSEWGVPLNRRR